MPLSQGSSEQVAILAWICKVLKDAFNVSLHGRGLECFKFQVFRSWGHALTSRSQFESHFCLIIIIPLLDTQLAHGCQPDQVLSMCSLCLPTLGIFIIWVINVLIKTATRMQFSLLPLLSQVQVPVYYPLSSPPQLKSPSAFSSWFQVTCNTASMSRGFTDGENIISSLLQPGAPARVKIAGRAKQASCQGTGGESNAQPWWSCNYKLFSGTQMTISD